MDEIRARVISNAAVLQFQGSLPDFTRTNTGNEEIDCLSLDMETLAHGPTAALYQDGIVFRGSVTRNDVNLTVPSQHLLHQIDMLDHSWIDRGHFARVMTAEDMIEIIQCGEIVLPASITIPDPQPFIGMHVIKRQLAFWKSSRLGTRKRRAQEPTAQ